MSMTSAGTLMHNNTKPSGPGAAGQCEANKEKMGSKEQDGHSLVRSFCEDHVNVFILS